MLNGDGGSVTKSRLAWLRIFFLESPSDMKGRVLPSQAFFNLSSNSRKHNEEQNHLVPEQIMQQSMDTYHLTPCETKTSPNRKYDALC